MIMLRGIVYQLGFLAQVRGITFPSAGNRKYQMFPCHPLLTLLASWCTTVTGLGAAELPKTGRPSTEIPCKNLLVGELNSSRVAKKRRKSSECSSHPDLLGTAPAKSGSGRCWTLGSRCCSSKCGTLTSLCFSFAFYKISTLMTVSCWPACGLATDLRHSTETLQLCGWVCLTSCSESLQLCILACSAHQLQPNRHGLVTLLVTKVTPLFSLCNSLSI